MDSVVAFIVATVMLLEVQGKNFHSERQVLNSSSRLPPQPGQQRYATKEVILYLTPSQIRALQEGKGLINPPQVNVDSGKHTQAYVQSPLQDVTPPPNEPFHSHLTYPQPLKRPPVQDAQSDPFIPIAAPHDYHQPEPVAYNNFQLQNQKGIPKPISFFPKTHKEVFNNEPKNIPTLRQQEANQGIDNNKQITRQQLKEQWLHLLNQNIAHFKALEASYQDQREKSNENKLNFHYLSQNEHRSSNHKDASDVYNLVRSNNKHLEKQQALLQADTNANSPPILVHKEINIKHAPAHLIAHVPVPTPVLIPVPDFFKVKAARTFAIPLEVLKSLPAPILHAPTEHVDLAVPIELDKRIPLPVPKNLYIDRPFFADNVVPIENLAPNRGNLPIHNHEWHH